MTQADAVICLGDNTIDRYQAPVRLDLVGGSCVNVAVGLARCGVAAAYIGPVGDDADGERVRAEIAAAGVDVSHVVVLGESHTAVTEIQLLLDGERRFLSERYEIFDAYQPDASTWVAVSEARHVHTSCLPHLFDRVRIAAGEGALSVSCDFSTAELPRNLGGLDVAFRSAGDAESPELALALAREAIERGASAGVVTRGRAGSVALTDDGVAWQEAIEIEPIVDTCGAGDAFIAAYLALRLTGESVVACLAAGAGAGALACTTIGAFAQQGTVARAAQ